MFSERLYPLAGTDLAGFLTHAWSEGWLDDYSKEHFLIKAIEGKLENQQCLKHYNANNAGLYHLTKDEFQENFV